MQRKRRTGKLIDWLGGDYTNVTVFGGKLP